MNRDETPRAPHEPERLGDGASGDAVLDELGRWFKAIPPARAVDDAGLTRVARRLGGPASRPLRSWRSSALVFALLAVTGAAAATWGVRHAFAPGMPAAPPSASPAVKPARAPAVRRPSVPAAPLTPAPSAPPATLPETAETSGPERLSPRVSAPPSSTAAAESELARESQALERALTALRRERDPALALALLERYAADFPAGVLRSEADLARVDAHLALGQRDQALAVLTRLPLERAGRGLELGVVRGELYADRDCARAIRDFKRVLAANPPAALDERALYGRASCRARSGDDEGARADFTRYLERYPKGRFAQAVRDRLR